jgi:hypothetical protein
MYTIARYLIVFGIVLLLAGGIVYLAARSGLSLDKIPLGHLPGDIRISNKNLTCFFPIATMVILSLLLTIVLNVIVRFLNR